jgi:hypothetical protein
MIPSVSSRTELIGMLKVEEFVGEGAKVRVVAGLNLGLCRVN